MKMKKKFFLKIIGIIGLFFYGLNSSFSYTSSELITLYSDSPDIWTSLYTVPVGYDLILDRIQSSDSTEQISLRNSTGNTLAVVSGKIEYLGGQLVIKDDLQILSTPGTNVNIIIFGYLVNEDEDIENYIQGNSNAWSKNIFTKEDLDYIYFREFILFILLIIIRFFEIIIGRKMIMR